MTVYSPTLYDCFLLDDATLSEIIEKTTNSLDSIRSLVEEDLRAVNQFISNHLESDIPLIKELIQYILQCGGKRIRPLIVLLSARALEYSGYQHIQLAAVIELIHTATLLHDDVVDHATLRRGKKTANTIWGNAASVLVGDFLHSRAFQLVVRQSNQMILTIFADSICFIAEGEVLQLINCRNPDTTEESYFKVIEGKTAKLFEVAAQIGAALTPATHQYKSAMQQYGLNLGIAYQLIDDALDYHASPAETGKNLGNDLAEGKTTLPLIYAIQHCTADEKIFIQNAITTGSCDDLTKILSILHSTDAIGYTLQKAVQFAAQAKDALNVIPDSSYKEALLELVDFVVVRKY